MNPVAAGRRRAYVAPVTTPGVDGLPAALDALASWQADDAPLQLHPGDVGWAGRFGAEQSAAAVRLWDGDALGFLDEPHVLRLALARHDDAALAVRIADDLPQVLPGRGQVEVPPSALRVLLQERGWTLHDPWTQLQHDLDDVAAQPLRVAVVGADDIADRVAVQRAAFEGSTFTEDRWHLMAAGPAYREARCLVGRDASGAPVAAATVWSAGPGRPGLLEPLGVHRDHRGHGYGRDVALACAAALKEMGCSSARVCTPSTNTAAVAAYRAAGFRRLGEARDLGWPA